MKCTNTSNGNKLLCKLIIILSLMLYTCRCTTIGHTLDHGDDGGETMQTNVRVKRCFGTIFGGTSGGLTGSTGTGINGQTISGVQQLRSPRMFKQSLQNLFGIFGPSTFSNRLFPTFSNYGSSFGRLVPQSN
ncbi:hypothetical protein RDWZM_004275 [Blomia tropicalis]|uniref:Secreted protein n=1 Tax=Blomia tropicalis TaxID=40697 RepID=A0A9Q0RTH0_BLOTA|nr:hypothetical protein RDWZM_004275 [Blomia tropicalis]